MEKKFETIKYICKYYLNKKCNDNKCSEYNGDKLAIYSQSYVEDEKIRFESLTTNKVHTCSKGFIYKWVLVMDDLDKPEKDAHI